VALVNPPPQPAKTTLQTRQLSLQDSSQDFTRAQHLQHPNLALHLDANFRGPKFSIFFRPRIKKNNRRSTRGSRWVRGTSGVHRRGAVGRRAAPRGHGCRSGHMIRDGGRGRAKRWVPPPDAVDPDRTGNRHDFRDGGYF